MGRYQQPPKTLHHKSPLDIMGNLLKKWKIALIFMLDNGLKVEEFFGSKHLSAVSEASAYFQNSALLKCYPTQKLLTHPLCLPVINQWLSYN
jgi:hypothetical protein